MWKPASTNPSRSVPPSKRAKFLHSAGTSVAHFANQSQADLSRLKSHRTLSTDFGAQEKREVEGLSEWNQPPLHSESLSKMRMAAFGVPGRTSGDVEKLLLQRKAKTTAFRDSQTSESAARYVQEVSTQRVLKREEEHLNKERSKRARRYEEELQSTISTLQSTLSTLRANAQACREEASRHRGLVIDIETSMKSSKKMFVQSDYYSRLSSKAPKPEDIVRFMLKKSQSQAALFTREHETRERVLVAKDAILRLRTEAEALDTRANSIQRELQEVRKVQLDHYSTLLKSGKDTRGQGLAWVVKKLWRAGVALSSEMFPLFLDEESIRIVIFIAQRSLEADDLAEYLLSIKPPSTVTDTQNTHDHWNNIHSRLKEMTTFVSRKQSLSKPTDVQSTRPSEEPGTARNQSSVEVLSQYSDVKAIEARIKELQELIQRVQNAEIRRLTTECFMNSYEKKFNVTLKTLLSAIVGVDVLDRYIATVNKEQKTLAEQLSQTKTFYFLSSNP